MPLAQFIMPFYEALADKTYRQDPVVGQIGRVVVPIPNPLPQILEAHRAEPRKHEAIDAKIRNLTSDDFKKENHLPIYRLHLRAREELLVQRAKRRYGVVVSMFGSSFDDVEKVLRQQGKTHLQERNILVAPIYPSQCEEHPAGLPPAMRSRIGALMYSQFFPMPKNNTPYLMDGVARLDRLLPVVPKGLAWDPLPIRLTDSALALLLAMLRMRFGSTEEKEIEELRYILADAVPDEYRAA
jgi:hypothetical protein